MINIDFSKLTDEQLDKITSDFKNLNKQIRNNMTVKDLKEFLNKLELQENYNDMLVKELDELKAENDRMQEHLMHNEAELIPLRKENKDLHFKNDLLENICLQHQELTQWIEEQIDEVEPRIFKVEDNFIETLFDEIININHKPYTQAGRV
jgi:predicted nuclease with TOPRIM domain